MHLGQGLGSSPPRAGQSHGELLAEPWGDLRFVWTFDFLPCSRCAVRLSQGPWMAVLRCPHQWHFLYTSYAKGSNGL